jgi:hypothetical protein
MTLTEIERALRELIAGYSQCRVGVHATWVVSGGNERRLWSDLIWVVEVGFGPDGGT